ncbi:MAG TPA: helix-turn-helix domain-containing protein [Candidatus Enterenecus stercoripullorum]|nr:helix-turn-helix domain-containing protein [Candidatus Enterenecus stercoripullorum]
MKQPSYKGFAPLSDAVIDAAYAGDVDAMDRILRHYDGYINKLCVRKHIDGSGNVHYDVDEYMKRRLQIKLIHSIVVTIEGRNRPRKRKCLYSSFPCFR